MIHKMRAAINHRHPCRLCQKTAEDMRIKLGRSESDIYPFLIPFASTSDCNPTI